MPQFLNTYTFFCRLSILGVWIGFVLNTEQTLRRLVVENYFAIRVSQPYFAQGLGYEQVKVNRSIYGSNRLTPGKRTPWILKYLYHYLNFFSVLLIIAGSLCFVAYFLDVRQEPENVSVHTMPLFFSNLKLLLNFTFCPIVDRFISQSCFILWYL